MLQRIGLCLSSIFSVATLSHAKIGKLEDVIQAAIDDEEPVYIRELMGEIGKELRAEVQARKIQTPEQKLVL